MTNRLSLPSVLLQNFLFCTVIAIILWKLVPSLGRYGFFNSFVHAQAIGNSICLLTIAVSQLARYFQLTNRSTILVSFFLVIPFGVYLGMALAGWGLGLPRGPFEFLQDTDQLIISAVTAVIASIAFNWHLSNREKLLQLALIAAEERHHADRARHAMLQAQLEPHMLFNTLANLRVLIGSDTERAIEMLDRLDSFLRETLISSQANVSSSQAYNSSGTLTLKHEFKILDDYLALMQIRLGKRLVYALDLPAECEQVQLPPLLLQPLAENSIRHGIEPQIDGGRIDVSARVGNKHLTLIVADTGTGISASQVKRTGQFNQTTDTSTAGFGLANLQERLQHFYKGDAETRFESAETDPSIQGTQVSIRIPLLAPVAGSVPLNAAPRDPLANPGLSADPQAASDDHLARLHRKHTPRKMQS